MYTVTFCSNQMCRAGKQYADDNNQKYVCCKVTKELCVAQRWCPEQQKYIVSERAKNICKNFKG